MNKKLFSIICSVFLLAAAVFFPEAAGAQVQQQTLQDLRVRALDSVEKQTKPDKLRIKPLEKGTKLETERSELHENVERFREIREEKPDRLSNVDYQKEMLLRAIDSLIKHAELLRERVQNFPVIHEDVQASIDAEITADIAALENFKTQVQEADSVETLQELAQKLREHRKDVSQKTVRKLMLLAHVGVYEHRILEVTTARADRIAEKLDEFEELGKEVSALEELLEQAKSTIAAASEDLNTIKQNISDKDINETVIQEVRDDLQNVRTKIKTVYNLFRDIAKGATEL